MGLSGKKASIYSVIMKGDTVTLFDHFISENIKAFESEIRFMVGRLKEIGHHAGAREQFFKTKEGKPGDGVCALYDCPDSNLRLYCIRYGSMAIILGGGGHKPKAIKAWQEDEKLSTEANTIMQVSKDITQRLASGDLEWSTDGFHLTGNLNTSEDEEE